jgi:hypothetical protein
VPPVAGIGEERESAARSRSISLTSARPNSGPGVVSVRGLTRASFCEGRETDWYSNPFPPPSTRVAGARHRSRGNEFAGHGSEAERWKEARGCRSWGYFQQERQFWPPAVDCVGV